MTLAPVRSMLDVIVPMFAPTSSASHGEAGSCARQFSRNAAIVLTMHVSTGTFEVLPAANFRQKSPLKLSHVPERVSITIGISSYAAPSLTL